MTDGSLINKFQTIDDHLNTVLVSNNINKISKQLSDNYLNAALIFSQIGFAAKKVLYF
jgi:hypothetical protein